VGTDGAGGVLITYRVFDPDGFSSYVSKERLLAAAAGGHIVVQAGELFDADGLLDRVTLLRFDDTAAAAAWVRSDRLRALQRAHERHVEARLRVIANACFDGQ